MRHVAVVFTRLVDATVNQVCHGHPIDLGVTGHQGLQWGGSQVIGTDRRQGAAVAAKGSADSVADEGLGHGFPVDLVSSLNVSIVVATY